MLTGPGVSETGPAALLDSVSEKCWSQAFSTDISQEQFWNKMRKERTCHGGKVVGRSIAVPISQMGKTEAQRGKETCFLSHSKLRTESEQRPTSRLGDQTPCRERPSKSQGASPLIMVTAPTEGAPCQGTMPRTTGLRHPLPALCPALPTPRGWPPDTHRHLSSGPPALPSRGSHC